MCFRDISISCFAAKLTTFAACTVAASMACSTVAWHVCAAYYHLSGQPHQGHTQICPKVSLPTHSITLDYRMRLRVACDRHGHRKACGAQHQWAHGYTGGRLGRRRTCTVSRPAPEHSHRCRLHATPQSQHPFQREHRHWIEMLQDAENGACSTCCSVHITQAMRN